MASARSGVGIVASSSTSPWGGRRISRWTWNPICGWLSSAIDNSLRSFVDDGRLLSLAPRLSSVRQAGLAHELAGPLDEDRAGRGQDRSEAALDAGSGRG